MKKLFTKIASKIKDFFFSPIYTKLNITNDSILDARYDEVKKQIEDKTPGNIVKYGYKCYSGGEEDGIIAAIFNTIPVSNKVFLEIGCGFGIENNTHFMLLNDWKGTWIDGEKKFIDAIKKYLGSDTFNQLLIKNYFVDKNNINEIFNETLTHFGTNEIDFFSLDIDGNDYHLMETMFSSQILPKVICVEYNGKFPYPCNVKVAYKQDFVWMGDDYMGVSLGAWVELFNKYNYTLLSCDATGNNAFFIKNEYTQLFNIYTPEELYQPSRYYLVRRRVGHKPTMKFLKDKLTKSNS